MNNVLLYIEFRDPRGNSEELCCPMDKFAQLFIGEGFFEVHYYGPDVIDGTCERHEGKVEKVYYI